MDDATYLKTPIPDGELAATIMSIAHLRQLRSYIPYCQHGSVLVTSRSKGAAMALVEQANIIAIEPMEETDALRLFQKKLGQSDDEDACTIELAAALEYMPLAIVQAAAYLVQRRPRYSTWKYLDEFRNSDKRKAKLLSLQGGELRRDVEAKNSILVTSQISFDYIRKTRPSAADLLSLMSFCDRQGIPETLLRGPIDHASGECTKNQSHAEFHLDAGQDHDVSGDDDGSIHSRNDSDSDSDLSEQQSNYSDNDRFENDV